MLKQPNYVYGTSSINIPATVNFGELILEKMSLYGERTAFINAQTGERVRYSEIAQEAVNLAVSLTRLGVRRGQTVAVCSENRREFFSTFIGAACTGAAVTPINHLYTNDEFKHVLTISKPQYIFCSPTTYKTHGTAIKSMKFIGKIIVFGDEKFPFTLTHKDLVSTRVPLDEFLPADVVGQTDTLFILYSSGTTGLPKGVMLTHYNGVVYILSNMLEGVQPEFVSMSVAPWYHAFGLWGSMDGLAKGRTMVYLPKFEERLYLESIQRYKPETLSVVPPILVMLSKSRLLDQYDVSSVQYIFCGAAPIDMDTIGIVKSRFPKLQAVLQGWGMTEATLTVTRDRPETGKTKPGSVGTMFPGYTIKIVDVETRKPLGPNERGEICVKGLTIMKGYVGKQSGDDFDDEGFFKTGDIAYRDDEGFFFIVDRIKELIKYKGYQVPPAEIEAQLLQLPGVQDAGVVGVPHEEAGEVPMAFVVRQPGVALSEAEVMRYIAEKLSSPKHLRGGVRFIDRMPHNPSGKILRKELRKLAKKKASKSKL